MRPEEKSPFSDLSYEDRICMGFNMTGDFPSVSMGEPEPDFYQSSSDTKYWGRSKKRRPVISKETLKRLKREMKEAIKETEQMIAEGKLKGKKS